MQSDVLACCWHVCLSVCHKLVLYQKWCKLGSQNLCQWIAPGV